MVAASKMRKAQERMRHARPYGEKIRNVAAAYEPCEPRIPPSLPRRARHGKAHRHDPITRQGPVRGPEHQRAALALSTYKEWQTRARRWTCAAHPATGASSFISAWGEPSSRTCAPRRRPQMDKLIGAVKVIGRVYERQVRSPRTLLHALINTMTGAGDGAAAARFRGAPGRPTGSWDYLYEPTLKVVLDQVSRATSRRSSSRP